MKLADISDYFRLRRTLREPWAFIQERNHPRPGMLVPLRFKDGPMFYLRSGARDRHIFHRLYLKDEYGIVSAGLTDLDCVIDIGGHIGIFAFIAAPRARRVLTFEPLPEHYELMVKNLSHPQLSHIVCVNAAVTDGKTKETTTYVPGRRRAGGGQDEAVVVPALSLADIFETYQVKHCDLMKMDCEGAEYEILFSAPRELLSRISRISLEYHEISTDSPMFNPSSLHRYLREAGFTVTAHPRKRNKKVGLMFCQREGGV